MTGCTWLGLSSGLIVIVSVTGCICAFERGSVNFSLPVCNPRNWQAYLLPSQLRVRNEAFGNRQTCRQSYAGVTYGAPTGLPLLLYAQEEMDLQLWSISTLYRAGVEEKSAE